MKKFIVVMMDKKTKENYLKFFQSHSKRDVCKMPMYKQYALQAVFNFNDKNISRAKSLIESLNRLSNIDTRRTMRMWNVNPKKMCREHLLGEHLEMHMFIGTIKKGISINAYIKKGLVNPNAIKTRHDELAKEMTEREYNHLSPIEFDCSQLPVHFIAVKRNERELRNRCAKCKF